MHAVPRPVLGPAAHEGRRCTGRPGSVLAALVGGVEVHGPSTDKLTTTLAWTDLVDDVTLDGPGRAGEHGIRVRRLRAARTTGSCRCGSSTRPCPLARVGGRGAAQHRARAARHPAPPGALPVPRLDPLPGVLRPPAARTRPDRPRRRRAERGERGARDLGAVDGAARRPEGALGAAAVPVGRDRGARAAVRAASGAAPRPAHLPRAAVELQRRRRAARRAARRRRRRQPGLPAAEGRTRPRASRSPASGAATRSGTRRASLARAVTLAELDDALSLTGFDDQRRGGTPRGRLP